MFNLSACLFQDVSSLSGPSSQLERNSPPPVAEATSNGEAKSEEWPRSTEPQLQHIEEDQPEQLPEAVPEALLEAFEAKSVDAVDAVSEHRVARELPEIETRLEPHEFSESKESKDGETKALEASASESDGSDGSEAGVWFRWQVQDSSSI